uniref:Uncharacterized protein n=1 Tax=Magallana gigas TaxID=29159 RepID=K1PTD6_MAGGI
MTPKTNPKKITFLGFIVFPRISFRRHPADIQGPFLFLMVDTGVVVMGGGGLKCLLGLKEPSTKASTPKKRVEEPEFAPPKKVFRIATAS